MSDSVRDLLVRGIGAAQSGEPQDRAEAKFYLRWVLDLGDTSVEDRVTAWLWLADIEEDPKCKREYLENALALEPSNARGRRALAELEGRLAPETLRDVLAPEEPLAPPSPTPPARRYMCLKCGGTLAFDPDPNALRCVYCGHHVTEFQALMEGALVAEQDFSATLPTARAHRWELAAERTLRCAGCGAIFHLPAREMSGACPFCSSPHIVAAPAPDLLQPDGVVPFALDATRAREELSRWMTQRGLRSREHQVQRDVTALRGIYVPFWTFDVGGQIQWNAQVARESNREIIWIPHRDQYMVYCNDLLVAASHTVPQELVTGLGLDTRALTLYAPEILANWAAEVYQISMADASLVARQKAIEEARRNLTRTTFAGDTVRDMGFDTHEIIIESYKLVLLPVWLGSYRFKGESYPVAVNGQTGATAGREARHGLGLFGL